VGSASEEGSGFGVAASPGPSSVSGIGWSAPKITLVAAPLYLRQEALRAVEGSMGAQRLLGALRRTLRLRFVVPSHGVTSSGS
jgi:hypothetical protein